jgi:hypothetical protein
MSSASGSNAQLPTMCLHGLKRTSSLPFSKSCFSLSLLSSIPSPYTLHITSNKFYWLCLPWWPEPATFHCLLYPIIFCLNHWSKGPSSFACHCHHCDSDLTDLQPALVLLAAIHHIASSDLLKIINQIPLLLQLNSKHLYGTYYVPVTIPRA